MLFGGTGALALRKLLPALFRLFVLGHFGSDSRLFAVACEPLSLCAYRDLVQEALRCVMPDQDPAQVRHFLNRVEYLMVDVDGESGWDSLATALPEEPRLRVFYFATRAELFGGLCERLAHFGLARPPSRLVLEKPIGGRQSSAAALHGSVVSVFDESRIYRIDH